MPDIFVAPGKLQGKIRIPVSKSVAHRAIICAALAGDRNLACSCKNDLSEDIKATCEAVTKLLKREDEIFCNESGSTLRFLIPVAAAMGIETTFTGAGRLPERPLGEYSKIFENKGVNLNFSKGRFLPVKISGKLKHGEFTVPGDVSSQYITGLLLALPMLDGDSKILVKGTLESAAYVDLTIRVMQHFGVRVERQVNGYFVHGKQKYLQTPYTAEGDYSQAAFWMTANYLGSNIDVEGLDPSSVQGDKKIKEILREYSMFKETSLKEKQETNCNILFNILGKQKEKAVFEIDASQIPDLIPVICVAAASTDAITRVINAGRLRLKESDRIKTTCELIKSIGGTVAEKKDGMIIRGNGNILNGGEVDSYGDHRIAMAAAIAALRTKNGIKIKNFRCIDKSYPKFFDDFKSLGGTADELNMG